MNDQPPRVRNSRGQGQILRQQLIQATARLLAELQQPESLTLRQVAREVGVAPASIYSHFDDLGCLLDHVLRLRYAELMTLMNVANNEATALGRLANWCSTFIGWGIDHPGEYRTLFGGRTPSGVRAPAHSEGLQLLEATTNVLIDVIDSEHSLLSDERSQAGILLWTSMHGLISAYTEHPDVEWPPLGDLISGIVALHASVSRDIATALLAGQDRGAIPERPQLRTKGAGALRTQR